MTDNTDAQVVATLAALAQDTRLAILKLVATAGEQGVPAGEIARITDTPPSTLSFHLKELSQAGVLKAKPQGRFIYYALQESALVAAVTFLQACLPVQRTSPVSGEGPKSERKAGSKQKRSGGSTEGQLNIFGE